MKFKESALAHKYLDGLVGIEIGASAHNPFGLDTKNVDYTTEMDVFKQGQIDLCGECSTVDIVSPGDNLPLADNEVDFVISSHAIEHFFDPIKAINEWLRVAKKYVFIIAPHKDRTFDKDRKRTTPEELKLRNSGELTQELLNDPEHHYFNGETGPYGHWSVWDTEAFVALCQQEGWNIVDIDDIDDKVGNGFTIVLSKKARAERSLSPKCSTPYYILAPNYTDSSAGVIALHMLCHALNISGKECYVTSDFFDLKQLDVELPSESTGERVVVNDNLRTPILSSTIINQHKKAKRKPIIIYPETVEDNPLNADLVVRYLLNKPGYLGGRDSYDESEMLFTYSEDFLPDGWNVKTLYIPTSDLTLFNPHETSERKGTYFFANRYLKQGGELLDVTKDSTELSFEKKKSLAELAQIFKKAELLYSYERTALCIEAMLCGCPVVYLPNDLLTSIPSFDLFGSDGAAWGATDEQIKHAKNTVNKIYPKYLSHEKLFWQQLDVFMVDTQLMAKLRESEFKDTYHYVEKLPYARNSKIVPSLKIAILSADLRGHACSSIRIESVLNSLKGECEYRYILKPYINDGEDEVFTDEELVEWADLIIIQRTAAQYANADILAKIFASDSVVVYETDDLLTEPLPESNVLHASFKKHISYIREVVKKANLITVSTPYLERHMSDLNSNIKVLPNLVDNNVWKTIKPLAPAKQEGKLKILYAGTITHIADLESIENALFRLHAKYQDKIEFIFAGCTTDKLKAISTLVLKKSVSYEKYVEIVQGIGAGIALAPLVDDPFNNSKSNIKWLEYSMCGCAGVYANVEAYNSVINNGLTGLLASTEEEWYLAIERLILNGQERHNIAVSAQKEVLKNYTLSVGSKLYFETWKESVAIGKYAKREEIDLPVAYDQGYQYWQQRHRLMPAQVELLAERMAMTWKQHPTFHLLIAVNYNELTMLADTLNSLQEQLYTAWGLTILSHLPRPDIFDTMPENIEWIEITDTLNKAINQSVNETGLDWLMQIMPGDKLLPHALLRFADVINQNTESRFIYSDEVGNENKDNLLFKPDFNIDLLRSTSYIGRSAIIRRDVFQEIGGNTGLAYVYVTDLAFNVYELWSDKAIDHVADVLYIATDSNEDEGALSDSELSVRVAHFERLGISTRISLLDDQNRFHTKYLGSTQPLVSIVIANRNQASVIWKCIYDLSTYTDYINYEIVIVDQSSDIEDMDFIYQEMKDEWGERLNLLSYPEANYSAAINFGVSHAKGEFVVVLANSAMPVNNNWLFTMCSQAKRFDVGVVGARIIDIDNELVHAGGVLGVADDVHGLFLGQSFDDMGYMGRAQLTQEYTFVSSACFMMSVEDYQLVGGLDEGDLANTKYCMADFCLRLKQQGLKTLWEPQVVFRQNMDIASHSNGIGVEYKTDVETLLIKRWPNECQNDGAYNRNLSLRDSDFPVDKYINLLWDFQNNKRPRILAFPFNNGAIGHYRVIEPLRELTHAAMIESTLLPGHDGVENIFIPNRFEINKCQPDILLMHLTLNDDFYEFLKWIKAETNIFVIFSIDDLVTTLPSKNDSKKKLHKDMRHRLRRTLALSDRVITSTQPLADALAPLNDNIVVMPNCIELARWERVVAKPNTVKKLRIGWTGGQYHAGDLDIISEIVKATASEVDWIFMGMCPKELKPYIHEYHEFTTLNEYPEKLASLSLDLALAPLEIHPFNEAKSNLKLLEYGMLACPVICSDIYPYQTNNPPVIRVNNTIAEWLDAVRSAIADPERLRDKGRALRSWVLKHYVLEHKKDQWLKALISKH